MREKIFRILTIIMGFIFFCGAAALDSANPLVPILMVVVSGAWLVYRAYDYHGFD